MDEIKQIITWIPEVDEIILSKMNINKLNLLCRSNNYLNDICSCDKFWKLKIINDFSEGLTKDKQKNKTYKNIYIYLHNLIPDSYIANSSTRYNLFELLKWLVSKNIFPIQYYINEAAGNGFLESIKLLSQYNKNPDIDGVNIAACMGKIEILEWMYHKHKLLPSTRGIEIARRLGVNKTIEWVNNIQNK